MTTLLYAEQAAYIAKFSDEIASDCWSVEFVE